MSLNYTTLKVLSAPNCSVRLYSSTLVTLLVESIESLESLESLESEFLLASFGLFFFGWFELGVNFPEVLNAPETT